MAVATVQHTSATGSGTSLAKAFGSNNAAGNLLTYITGSFQTISAATDNNTNTIANAATETLGNGNMRIDYVASSHAGANTVTAHVGSSDDIHLHIREVSGCQTSSPVNDTGTGTGTSATATVTTTGTSTNSGDYCLAAFYDNNHASGYTAIAPYALGDSTGGAGGDAMGSEDKAATASGSQTATMTNVFGSTAFNGIIATFKAAASASGYGSPVPRTAGPCFAI